MRFSGYGCRGWIAGAAAENWEGVGHVEMVAGTRWLLEFP